VEDVLNFEFDESDLKVTCYTNVEWIKEKYKHRKLNFVEELKDCDICIVDSYYELKDDYRSSIKINIDHLSNNADAYISPDHIVYFLNLIEKYESEDYGIGMTDFNDIKAVTKGSLIEYVKINLNSDDEREGIEEFRRSLKPDQFNVGVILFVSLKNSNRLFNFTKVLEDIYPHMEAVVMTPDKRENNAENYVEVFVFKKV
jgi:hypothetical protein